MICRTCGAPQLQKTGAYTSRAIKDLVDETTNHCFCGMTERDMLASLAKLDKATEEVLNKWFPGETIPDIKRKLHNFPVDDPLRAECITRLTYTRRLRDKILEVRKAKRAAKIEGEIHEEDNPAPTVYEPDRRNRHKLGELLADE